MASLMKNMMGGGMEGGGMEAMMAGLKDNPLLQQAFAGNPEMEQLLNNPEELTKKVAEMQQLMNSDEGREASAKIMEEVQSVLTDPEKMRMGLEQFANNPLLKGVADAVPELKEVCCGRGFVGSGRGRCPPPSRVRRPVRAARVCVCRC